jgi:predicted alpha/beta superfamily hydrolase
MRWGFGVASLAVGCAGDATGAPAADAGAVDAPIEAREAGVRSADVTEVPDRADAPTDAPALEIVVFRAPGNTPSGGAVFAAGTFNGWTPGDPGARLVTGANGTLTARVVGLAPGQRVEFKFTRGTWATVERDDRGADIANRAVTFDPAHPVVALFIERWADLPAPASTRSGEIRVLRDVVIPQLGRTRNVWVYLPPGYAASSERFPVAYMFDGQNLFDARASAFGQEWQVDEALEALHYEGRLPGLIVVGVENSSARGCEYNVFTGDPHPACADGSALGDRTVAFLVDTLKPRIDREFRTRPGRDDTAVAGSSMGGSMAVRAGFAHPEVFSGVAALSPSYQNVRSSPVGMPAYVASRRPPTPFRFHQDIGSAEQIREIGPDVLRSNMMAVRDAAQAAGVADAMQRAVVVDGATHDEARWSARIGEVLAWLRAR